MTNDAHRLQLAWLADRFRAQATLGLHYWPDEADRERFASLRRYAAELAALTDSRDVEVIATAFAKDSGIHTPGAAIALHIATADSGRIWRAWHLPGAQSLPDALTAAVARIDAAPPGHASELCDTHALGLPDPHTHIAVYQVTSPLRTNKIDAAWPAPESAIQHAVQSHADPSQPKPAITPVTPVPVNSAAAAICRNIAALATEGAQQTSDPYNVERFGHLQTIAQHVTVEPIDYRPGEAFELCPDAAATGAEIAIRDETGRILLLQRSDTGQWAMPGGACEVGETWAATAVREAREEISVGLDAAELRLVEVFDNRTVTPEKTTIPVIAVFTTNVQAGQMNVATSREADDVTWVTAAELRELDLFPGHHTKITAAMNYARSRAATLTSSV